MNKNLGMIAGVVLVIGGLIAYNKAKTDKVNLEIKEDVGDKTMAKIVIGAGAFLLIREIVKNK